MPIVVVVVIAVDRLPLAKYIIFPKKNFRVKVSTFIINAYMIFMLLCSSINSVSIIWLDDAVASIWPGGPKGKICIFPIDLLRVGGNRSIVRNE